MPNTPWIQNPVNPNLWITTFDHQFDDEPVWSEGLVLKDGGSRDVHEGVGFERVGAGTPVEIRGRAGRVGARRWWHEGLVLQRVGVVSAEWRLGVEGVGV